MTPKKKPKTPKKPHPIPNRMVKLKGSGTLRKRNTQTMPRRK